jgi:uncharacterized membrane protein YeaQ/YmgE (transglycosylase-associated protein family)
MPGFDLLGWIVIGLLAASISGWLAPELNGRPVEGFIGALVFATIGSMVVRLAPWALEDGGRR